MKHVLRTLFLLALLMLGSTQSIYATPQEGRLCKQHTCQYIATYKHIYHTMKDHMDKAPITGNATLDFLYEMIPHHEAAIGMSKNILKYTDNAELKTLAQKIITAQEQEVGVMKGLIAKLQQSSDLAKDDDTEYIKAYHAIMAEMDKGMSAQPNSSNVNVLFLEEMIPHHKGAIAMAENILLYTTNPAVHKLAQQIVQTQKDQLPEMEQLLIQLKQ
ncbi:MAG: DUF305 domain-containing protein [Cellulosilyticaceae bacterium]